MAAGMNRVLTSFRQRTLPMSGRDPGEDHRAATPLELFFDLCFVVAVAFAAGELHHSLVEGDLREGVVDYIFIFFAIWLAWLNFTWFASAYDVDDVAYRVTTMVQIAGALIFAAGIPRAMADDDLTIVVSGFVVMRLAMVTQWLRVAYSDPPRRTMALRFALGIAVAQVFWIAWAASGANYWWLFLTGAVIELLIPVWAEKAARSPWHFHHIVERYGLFNIIMLGESVLAGTIAFQVALDEGGGDTELLALAISGALIVFSMWWLYFDYPEHDFIERTRTAFAWGYGHLFIFGAAAAVGVGIEVAVDYKTDHSILTQLQTGLAAAIPVAMYVLGVWWLHRLRHLPGYLNVAFPAAAALILASALTPLSLLLIAAVLVGLVALVVIEMPHIERAAEAHASEHAH
jgi:low temperature requirement protein LtrA